MKITLNGQLQLSMLAERLVDNIDNLTLLQINTDGLTVKVLKNDEEKVKDICKKWENYSGLELEYAYYSKMVIRDVNNYAAQYDNGKIKYKGDFEIEKDLHKDHSMLCVPKALSEYFFNNIPINDALLKYDIFDFCKRFSSTEGWQTCFIDNTNSVTNLQKTTRYIVSNKGGLLYKRHEDGRAISIEANNHTLIANDITKVNLTNIDYLYYYRECNKIINTIENNQLTLF